ncbi:hypothetical protein NBRC116583_20470 [Arenicella sp. 4NH20-0111]|uniref:hypothetical protein n=1 Tax=Arenicella sp. 4NH20-0111 TaxID=3127648 RepID=UPI003107C852
MTTSNFRSCIYTLYRVSLVAVLMSSFSVNAVEPQYEKPLGAGVTRYPNTNYEVTNAKRKDFQEPHNTRIADPYHLLVPKLSPFVPVNVKPHSRLVLSDIEDRPFFDYFGWQAFIGLIWPADENYRGKHDVRVKTPEEFVAASQQDEQGVNPPIVLETMHTFDAAFPGVNGSMAPPTQPKAWNAEPYARPFNLDLVSKGKAPKGLNEAFSSPLIDQNRQYVRYNLQLNEVMYEFVRQNKWYLKENLPKAPTQATLPPLPVPIGTNVRTVPEPYTQVSQPQTNTTVIQPVNGNSIELKAAWRVMITEADLDPKKPWRQVDDLSRYFVSKANIYNPITEKVEQGRLVGLVGLHIVAKTPQFTQGLWSSFEHVDNLTAPTGGRASFKKNDKFWPQGYSYVPKSIMKPTDAVPEKKRKPVEVSRVYKIPQTPVAKPDNFPMGISTVGMNKQYQSLLKGTVWENYQLVITQWPTDPTSFYASPFYYPRGFGPFSKIDPEQPQSIKDAYNRANVNAKAAYPRWSGLPIPQVGALNSVMETYFQNPLDNGPQPMENTSCMGCHYGASDLDYSWAFKLRTWPSSFNQGRVNDEDSALAKEPANGSPANAPIVIEGIAK